MKIIDVILITLLPYSSYAQQADYYKIGFLDGVKYATIQSCSPESRERMLIEYYTRENNRMKVVLRRLSSRTQPEKVHDQQNYP